MMKYFALSALALCLSVGVLTAAPPVVYDLTPLSSAADESGFGTLVDSQVSPFAAVSYSGTIDSRVYTNAGATVATFVWEIKNSPLSLSWIEDVTIAATGLQNDLRILQIVNGDNGCIAGTDVPDIARATNYEFPIADELFYEWGPTDLLMPGESVTLYVQVTGVTQLGVVGVALQDFGGANATVLAPVDDPSSPDLTVPEPATMALMAVGFVGLLRRRR